MKEKLLHTADSLQEIDAAGIQGMDDAQSSWASLSTDGIIVEFPRADSQTSGNSGENGVQLHRMSRTSGISGLSGISGISAISGNGVSDGNSTAHTSDSFEKDPNVWGFLCRNCHCTAQEVHGFSAVIVGELSFSVGG